jgi:hypothetical protein
MVLGVSFDASFAISTSDPSLFKGNIEAAEHSRKCERGPVLVSPKRKPIGMRSNRTCDPGPRHRQPDPRQEGGRHSVGRRRSSARALINYRQKDVAARVLDITNGIGVDHIAEVYFGGNLTATLHCLRINGSIMIYVTNGDREPKVPVCELCRRISRFMRCWRPSMA